MPLEILAMALSGHDLRCLSGIHFFLYQAKLYNFRNLDSLAYIQVDNANRRTAQTNK